MDKMEEIRGGSDHLFTLHLPKNKHLNTSFLPF